MTKKDRQKILEHMADGFARLHSGWKLLKNPPGLPYLAIFYEKRVLSNLKIFCGFYNWRGEKFAPTVGWLTSDHHPRDRELVVRYLEEDGSLREIKATGVSRDFQYADFERGVGGLIPVSLGIAKSYDANMDNYQLVAANMIADIQGAGFDYLDLMFQHRFGKRLSEFDLS